MTPLALTRIIIAIVLALTATGGVRAQEAFNRHMEGRAGLGVSITGFSANVNYLIIPNFGLRIGRHYVGFDGFYGRLDNLPEREDWGMGLIYRAYPLKNKSWTRPFAETGFYYHSGTDSRYAIEGLLWRLGGGVEAALTDVIHVDIGVNFGLTHALSAESSVPNDTIPVAAPGTQVFFMPMIRISFAVGSRPMKKK